MSEPSIYWVRSPLVAQLAVTARPSRARHFPALKAAGIDVLVSLLEAAEAEDVGLGDEAGHCARAGIELLRLPVTDHGIPDTFEAVEEVVRALSDHLSSGRGVGAHCYAGLGRSPLLVASVLIHHGHTQPEAIEIVSAARGFVVPEMRTQHAWLMELERRRDRAL
ncbi:MAG: dual specificity protein phosphatase family protein [Hyphomicrobiaceae bacterium]